MVKQMFVRVKISGLLLECSINLSTKMCILSECIAALWRTALLLNQIHLIIDAMMTLLLN